MTKCSVEGCERLTHAKGWCRPHWARMHRYGRLEKIRGIDKGICSVENCGEPTDSLGLCRLHYHRQYMYGRLHKVNGEKRKHPFYLLWFERRRMKVLCNEWLDFWTFVKDVSPKPEGYFFLARIKDGLFGPDNFKWEEHLKREAEETDKEWWARKWASRQENFPENERSRHLERNFGITPEQYDEKLIAQKGVCAICGNEETSYHNGKPRRLAVDHSHSTGKIRDLLCWRCNTTIGKFNENAELIDKFLDYINKHKEPSNG